MSTKKKKGKKIPISMEEATEKVSDQEEVQAEQEAESAEAAVEKEPVAEGPDIEREMDELKQRMQRLAADYQNYQKRSYRQIEDASRFAVESLVKSLLPVLDNFEHALEKGAEADNAEAVLKGVQIVYDHLLSVLKGAGLECIAVEPGGPFDPAQHEAMLQEGGGDYPENSVVRELGKGYSLNERTLRPAKVSVAKAMPAAETEEEGGQDDNEELV